MRQGRDKLFTAVPGCIRNSFCFPRIIARPWRICPEAPDVSTLGSCKRRAELLLCACGEQEGLLGYLTTAAAVGSSFMIL